jgi:hypothetical protein
MPYSVGGLGRDQHMNMHAAGTVAAIASRHPNWPLSWTTPTVTLSEINCAIQRISSSRDRRFCADYT